MIYATRGAIFDGFMAKLHFDIFVYFYFLGSRRREPPRRGHQRATVRGRVYAPLVGYEKAIYDIGTEILMLQ